MIIYYSLLIGIGLCSLLTIDIIDKKKKSKIIIIISCLLIILLQGLRNESVGTDLKLYIPALKFARDMNFLHGEKLYHFELGYSLFIKILANMNVSNQLFLAICAAVIITPFGYIWIKKSRFPTLSVFIYITFGIFLFSFSGLRQSIAIAITFLSFRYIEKRQLIYFLICIIIAIMFHTSAIVFIIAYPLYKINIKPFNLFFVLISLLGIFILKSPLYRAIYYLYKGEVGEPVYTGAYNLLILMIFIYICSYLFVNQFKRTKELQVFQNYLLIAIIIQIFASQSNTITRAGFYYSSFITLLIPEVIYLHNDRLTKYVGTLCILIFLFYFYYINLSKSYVDVTPYLFYWQ